MTRLGGVRFFAAIAVACLGSIETALAVTLVDPTRPAPEWLALQPMMPGAAATASDSAPNVRVLVIGPARKFAIIDGQMIRVGETYNGARLVGFHADGVVIQKDGVNEKLSMTPAVVKKVEGSKPVVGRTKSGKKVVNGEGQ